MNFKCGRTVLRAAFVSFVALIPWVVPLTANAQPDEAKQLATKVRDIFERNCHRCHGQNGANEGGFNHALDFKKLVGGKVIAGNAAKSRVFNRLGVLRDMPPEDEKQRPTDDEIGLVKQWIEAGALAPPVGDVKPRPFIGLKDELTAMRDFLRKTGKDDRPFVRFFTLRHLHNMPADKVRDGDFRVHQAALSKLLNSLSWKKEIVLPQPADPAGTLFAVDLRRLNWDRGDLWREILKRYPYGLTHDQYPDDREINELADEVQFLSGTTIPAIRTDWFVATAARPPLYHILLQLPSTADALERRLEVDVSGNIQRGEITRAGFNASGVSGHNRLVERHATPHGAYWKSYDFKSSSGFGNLFVFPLGPRFAGNKFEKHAFKHDGGEIIFNLPNGLQGYLLVDGKDNRIDEGPIEVVSDSTKTSGTPLVVNGISCMACHQHGMIHFKDQVRVGQILGGEPRDFVRRVYAEDKPMDTLVTRDEERFLTALDQAIGKLLKIGPDAGTDIKDFPEPISAIGRWYLTQELTSTEAARELGLEDSKQLEGAIAANPRLQELGLFPLTRGNTIKREVWEHTEFLISPAQEAFFQLKLGTPQTNR